MSSYNFFFLLNSILLYGNAVVMVCSFLYLMMVVCFQFFLNLFKCYEHLCIRIYMDTYFLTCINILYESIIYHVDHMNMLASFFKLFLMFLSLTLAWFSAHCMLSSARPKWCSLRQVVVLFLRWSPLPGSLCLELWLPQPLQTVFILLGSLMRQERRPLLAVSSMAESRPSCVLSFQIISFLCAIQCCLKQIWVPTFSLFRQECPCWLEMEIQYLT